ncbi:MAG: hypothetical protein ACJA0N_000511 [Pseudohongiellaceae bacterium]|jgi:hypothetical protein
MGEWRGDKGVDVAPEPSSPENTPYHETMTFTAVGTANNAEQQTLVALQYLQVVKRQSDGQVFHHQAGYWMWDDAEQTVMQSLTIPRSVALLAGGKCEQYGESIVSSVKSSTDDNDWSIVQSPFMNNNAKTMSYKHALTVMGDSLSYHQIMLLDIYGKEFEHTDSNCLQRIK